MSYVSHVACIHLTMTACYIAMWFPIVGLTQLQCVPFVRGHRSQFSNQTEGSYFSVGYQTHVCDWMIA
jgi:hypothetical protein